MGQAPLSISPLSAVQWDKTNQTLYTHLYVLSCVSPTDILKGSGWYDVDGKGSFVPIPATIYYEHQIDDNNCAGYNLVFNVHLPDRDTAPEKVVYKIWGTNPQDVSVTYDSNLTLPVSVLPSPVPSPVPPTLHTADSIEPSLFINVSFTAQDITHVHIVIFTYPPRMDYVGFIEELTCDGVPQDNQFEPSQFENTFDVVEGQMNSRYNLSWLMGGVVCKEIGYKVVVTSPEGGQGTI
eukprot:CAMPEP_0201525222 /NCGR_PEP_ID=MMETSP0161_2-20130828/27282_1 /ASSEMBLY_ACC=CAM_ASM_000251 /TAXON_ID=180227 /ORGANISM="Neoparamoeba aestuarina, Strain SoJaBio B1-5/56/2" /LENGTH=236 /DNA_ID=CAMNT_0047925051 /DNA_START=106 /DNA_END=813 /DNA_ORIENTATION=-